MTNTQQTYSRRSIFGSAAAQSALVAGAVVAAAVPAMAQPSTAPEPSPPRANGLNDGDILNFALNLEYLEAEYYLRGVTGQSLDQAAGGNLGGQVRGGRQVSFANPRHRAFVENVARNELAHVQFLRGALGGKAVPRPTIDFVGGFAAVAQAAGFGHFDPFANEMNFFLGAMLFEDVGVTAYKGAAPLIRNKDYLQAAAGIHAVEAYHAGMIRTVLYKSGRRAQQEANKVSAVRDQLDGPMPLDQGIVLEGRANIVPADSNGISFSRTPQQVLNIVYAAGGGGINHGGFYPDGMNGKIQST
ncbi:MAG TPA: ferritin-like domain-containing protein [Rhizomicrobium sp.]|jgi:hypothetical protein|nr:ferritin-like domain-containing protein [Rhizomicrobium sp.]